MIEIYWYMFPFIFRNIKVTLEEVYTNFGMFDFLKLKLICF